MELINSIMIAASALKAQSGRMRVISENIANASSTSQTPGGDPYQRRLVTFEQELNRELGVHEVRVGRIALDDSDFGLKFDPGHPGADESGYVKVSNVNTLIEMMDMREAQRSYEANLNVIRSSRTMASRTLDILRV